MNDDMSRSAIELGPVTLETDEEPGETCSTCRGHGGGEDWREVWHDCPACDGAGVAS